MSPNQVYEEWNRRLVPSNHGSNIYYRVFEGTVNWEKSSSGMQHAITILMQYGNTEDWQDAKSKNEINFSMPAHILSEDLGAVMEAIELLSGK